MNLARLKPATRPTLYFIGVTTGKSSIMKVFPAWADTLGLGNAVMCGVDLTIGAPADDYRKVVAFIKSDPLSMGALVTTHKLDLYRAAGDLFDEVDPHAARLGEASCLSKRDGRLIAHAKDALTAGYALSAVLPDGYFEQAERDVFIMGCGGAGLALARFLSAPERSANRPARILISDQDRGRLSGAEGLTKTSQSPTIIDTRYARNASANDEFLATVKPGSLVVNATGLGKDRPGSPLTSAGRFPQGGIVWEFNYRGNLIFLDQAKAQAADRNLSIHDGWVYFIHGWSTVIAEVFNIEIAPKGRLHDRLSDIAANVARRGN